MKVLHINAVSGIKSTGRIVVEIANYLNSYGNEGYIAYSAGLPYEKGYKVGSPLETKLHGLYSRIFGTQAYFSKNGTKDLLIYMENLKPDVVHLHNLHSNYINLELLLNFLAEHDIPTVLTLHDCWFFTGKCCHYTVDNCYKWQSGCFKCPRIHKDNPSWLLDRTKKMYQDKQSWFGKIPRLAVVGVSDWITKEARKSYLSSAKILTRIHNWIDLDVFRPVKTDLLRHRLDLNDKFIILGVSSVWNNTKGLNKFIELANLISEDTVILLVGNVSKDVNLPNNIININETHNVNELVEYYSMADIFLNLSLEETFGKVTAEALACGLPVVTNNSTANPELLDEGCGYISDLDDIHDVLEKISIVKTLGKSSYSDKCISHARQYFSIEDRIQDYINLYTDLTV